MKQPVGLLSGGQRQALTLLMATLVTPKLLLLDEHTAALDPATADKVLELTRHIVAEQQITCLMVTHNMHQALELGNRTLMMNGGRIVFDVQGEERSRMTVDDLLERFRQKAARSWTTTASFSARWNKAESFPAQETIKNSPANAPAQPAGRRFAGEFYCCDERLTSRTRWCTRSRTPPGAS